MIKAHASGGIGSGGSGGRSTQVTDTQLLKKIADNNRGKTRGTVIRKIGREELVNRLFGNSSRTTTNAQSSRTWNTRFSFNGSQISNDGKYQINTVRNGSKNSYELVQYVNGRSKRVGVYSSIESAKKNAK